MTKNRQMRALSEIHSSIGVEAMSTIKILSIILAADIVNQLTLKNNISFQTITYPKIHLFLINTFQLFFLGGVLLTVDYTATLLVL